MNLLGINSNTKGRKSSLFLEDNNISTAALGGEENARVLAFDRLASLVYPIDPQDFLLSVWPNHVHFSEKGGELLSELINQPEFMDIESFVNMPFGGLSRAHYNHQPMLPKTWLNKTQLIKSYDLLKATIYLQKLQTDVIKSWNISLDKALTLSPGTARMECFMSPKGKGLGWHYDDHEVFIVQVKGCKRWHLAANNWPKAIDLNHDRLLERDEWLKTDKDTLQHPSEFHTYDMYPGSTLYVPYGHWHRVENLQDSVHLVLNVSRSYLLTGDQP